MKTSTLNLIDGNPEVYKYVEELLSKLKGVERALIDVNDGEIKVEFNEDIMDVNVITNAIQTNGIKVKMTRNI